MLVLLVADLVEDEELRLGPDVADVGDAGLAQIRLGLARDMARVAREVLRVTGSTTLAMMLTVGLAKNGSRQAVSGSGTASMSDS